MKIDSDKLESLMKDAENHAKQGFSKAKEKVESIDRDELRQKVEEGLNTTKDAVKTGIEKIKEIDGDEVKEKVEKGLNTTKDTVKSGIEKIKEIDGDEVKEKVEEGLNSAKDAVKNKRINNKVIIAGVIILVFIFVGLSSLFGKSDFSVLGFGSSKPIEVHTIIKLTEQSASGFDMMSYNKKKLRIEGIVERGLVDKEKILLQFDHKIKMQKSSNFITPKVVVVQASIDPKYSDKVAKALKFRSLPETWSCYETIMVEGTANVEVDGNITRIRLNDAVIVELSKEEIEQQKKEADKKKAELEAKRSPEELNARKWFEQNVGDIAFWAKSYNVSEETVVAHRKLFANIYKQIMKNNSVMPKDFTGSEFRSVPEDNDPLLGTNYIGVAYTRYRIPEGRFAGKIATFSTEGEPVFEKIFIDAITEKKATLDLDFINSQIAVRDAQTRLYNDYIALKKSPLNKNDIEGFNKKVDTINNSLNTFKRSYVDAYGYENSAFCKDIDKQKELTALLYDVCKELLSKKPGAACTKYERVYSEYIEFVKNDNSQKDVEIMKTFRENYLKKLPNDIMDISLEKYNYTKEDIIKERDLTSEERKRLLSGRPEKNGEIIFYSRVPGKVWVIAKVNGNLKARLIRTK